VSTLRRIARRIKADRRKGLGKEGGEREPVLATKAIVRLYDPGQSKRNLLDVAEKKRGGESRSSGGAHQKARIPYEGRRIGFSRKGQGAKNVFR